MQKSIYLPSEGLQGEDIPSHIIWEDMDFESIRISFRSPLKFKEVYNSESENVRDECLIVQKVEWEGYLGLVFESSKTSPLEDQVSVEYSFCLSNGKVVKETKEISLFRPQLKIQEIPEKIIINPVTGVVKNRIRIKNVGRGTLIILITATEDSPTKPDTPFSERELLERMKSDLRDEMSNLGKEFSQFQPLVDEMFEWEEKELMELSEEERNRYENYENRLSNTVASNKELLRGFVVAFAKVLTKNIEVLENLRRFVRFYESLISKNILLINPFDSLNLTDEGQEIILKLLQTDRVLDKYEDITLPKIELISSKAGRVPVHSLFRWD